MRKMLIFGIAISLVLVSGGLFSAQAECGGCLSGLSPCNWHFPSLCGFHCGSRDADVAPAQEEVATSSCSCCRPQRHRSDSANQVNQI